MSYFEDDFIEEEVSSSINFVDLKHKLKSELKELQEAIKDNNKDKIKTIFINIENTLEWYC